MTDIAVYQPQSAALAVPETHDMDSWITVVEDVIKVANVIYDTPFVPDGLRGSAPATAAAMLAGREMGLGPMTSLANIDVIRGKPTQKPLLMRGMILSHGHKWEDVEVNDTRAIVKGCRKGESTWAEVTFTAAQAKTAGIDLGKYPADKLYARASSRLARRKFADVIMGMPYTSDELEDGETDDGPITEVPASNGHAEPAKAAPRTAQRRTRATPTTAATAAGAPPPAASATAQTAPDGAGLPPLPGEDEAPDPTAPIAPTPDASSARTGTGEDAERDYDTPGTITTPQLTAIWTVLRTVFAFTNEEKDQARAVAAHIISRAITSTREMSRNEGKTILDTLSNWQATAKERGEEPRELLIAYMAAAQAGQNQGASGEPEPGSDG